MGKISAPPKVQPAKEKAAQKPEPPAKAAELETSREDTATTKQAEAKPDAAEAQVKALKREQARVDAAPAKKPRSSDHGINDVKSISPWHQPCEEQPFWRPWMLQPWVKVPHPKYPRISYYFNEESEESVWERPEGAPE